MKQNCIWRWCRVGVWALLALSLFGMTARAQTKPAGGLLVCIGDSITAGEPRQIVGEGNDYVSLLRKQAKAAGENLRVQGQGRSGWTTGDYARNVDAMVREMPAEATIVTIMLGTNDTRMDAAPQEIAEQAVANLRKLVAGYAKKAPAARFVILSAPALYPDLLDQPMKDANYTEDGPAEVAALRDAYKAMAEEDGHAFVDVSDLPSHDKSVEGVHPDAAGHAELADRIWQALQDAKQ